MIVPILRSGVLAQQFCRARRAATIEAVFERSLYLRAGDGFICIGGPDIGNGPLTLIGRSRPVSGLDLQPGTGLGLRAAYHDRPFGPLHARRQ